MANVTHNRAIQRGSRKPKRPEPSPGNIVAAFRHRDPDRICNIDIGNYEFRAQVDGGRDAEAVPVTGTRSYHFERFDRTICASESR
jgi:hypothetical protein